MTLLKRVNVNMLAGEGWDGGVVGRWMNGWSEEQTGKEKSGSGRRRVAGISGRRRVRGGEAVKGEPEDPKGGGTLERAGGVRHVFNFLTRGSGSENKCFPWHQTNQGSELSESRKQTGECKKQDGQFELLLHREAGLKLQLAGWTVKECPI